MKEIDEEEDRMENNEGEQINKENILQYNKNMPLTSLESLIEVKDENKLKTMDTILREGSDEDIDTSNIIEDEEYDTTIIESSIPSNIYTIKNYIFIFALLMSSSLNCNFLYLPFILLGFILSFYISSNSHKIYTFKKTSEFLSFIYSLLLLIFKIVFIVLTKKDNSWVKEHDAIFIDLGIKILKDKDSTAYLVTTFIGESILIVIALVSFIISNILIDYNFNDETNKKITKKEMSSLLKKHLMITYIIFLGFAIFNTSVMTMIYILIINILLLSIAKHSNIVTTSLVFKSLGILIYILIMLQIFLINLLNTHHFNDLFILKTNENENDNDNDNENKYSPFTQIGINFMPYTIEKENALMIFMHWTSYLFAIIAMISLSSSNNNITFYKIFNMKENQSQNSEQDESNENKSNNFFIQFIIKTKEYFSSPDFILHICRIFAIGYLYFFRNIYAIIVFIWLFFSFLFLHININKTPTIFVIFSLLLSLICLHISNIDGLFEDRGKIFSIFDVYHFCLYKYEKYEYYVFYLSCNLFYFFICLFIYTLYESEEKKIIKAKIDLKAKIDINNENKEDDLHIKSLEENLLENKEQEGIIITDKTLENLVSNDIDDIKTRDRRVTNQIVSKEKKEPIEPQKIELNEKTIKKLKFLNIIKKTFLSHIDKISLVVMYFIAINSINIVHSILVIIFMIQLLFPKLIEYISSYLIVITQILYFVEFIIDILKHYFSDIFNSNIDLLQLFMVYDKDNDNNNDNGIPKTSVEIFIYGIVYCFHIQYKIYNNEFFKEYVLDEEINLANFIEVKLYNYPTLKNIFFFIGNMIIEIYIWILITLFIFFDSYFEISILFEIKLLLFLIIVYQFLISIQKSEKKHISLFLNWIFLIYCSLNTLSVYGYQIYRLNYFAIEDSDTDNTIKKNLPYIGLTHYKENLYIKFLPHFVCNFISILYIWEMKRILIKSNNIDKDNKVEIKAIITIKDKDNKENDENKKNEENDENEEEITASERYEKNKKEMKVLNLSYYLFSFILILTKFYWLFLFLSLCIIYTTYDLSIIMAIYILIFAITFIRMFYQIITKLTKFINERKSFFISRLLRYNLIEQKMHIKQNKYYRSIAFKYLLCLSFFSYSLFYSYGIYHLFQNCDDKKYREKNDEKKSHLPICPDSYLTLRTWVYIIGFYYNSREDTVFIEAWYHLFFAILISFDVYVQKIENYFTYKVEKNRKRYRNLSNENIKLKPLTFGEDNMLMNIGYGLKKAEEDINQEKSYNEGFIGTEKKEGDEKGINKSTRLRSSRNKIVKEIIDKKEEALKFNFEAKNKEEEKIIGAKLIEDFLKIFSRSTSKDVKLNNKNIKYQIIKVLKKIFEEMIIFFLICTSILKMNIWSLIYMFISLFLIITEKTMMRYYRLYCFIIFSTINQTALFVSNLQENSEPYGEEYIQKYIDYNFHIPWYRKKLKRDDKFGFFWGLGVSHEQIKLIWMEFIEIVIIYIYLDYFSYSIYQEANTIGRQKDKKNKINYYNLYLNKETSDIAKKLSKEEYEGHKLCMSYNFGVEIKPYEDFIFYMNMGVDKNYYEKKKKKLSSIKEEESENKSGNIKTSSNNDQEISTSLKENNKDELIVKLNDKENDNENYDFLRIKTIESEDYGEYEKNKKESPLLKALYQSGNLVTSTNLMEKVKSKKKKESGYFSLMKYFLYLSFHNVILIIIIIISMMISSLFSIFYITYSLYFLITSTSIYLGNKYFYPRAIKTILRIFILLDITIQILYQSPYINSDAKDDEDEIDFGKVLQIIGLNKILTFKADPKNPDIYDVILNLDQLFLVLAKALTYLFMSFQILVYSSQSFQEYYLSYIITKNNHLRRISLMNVFKFNNTRIEAMNSSINLRHDMSQSMNVLKKKLEQWNANLMMTKSDGRINETKFYIKPVI